MVSVKVSPSRAAHVEIQVAMLPLSVLGMHSVWNEHSKRAMQFGSDVHGKAMDLKELATGLVKTRTI
jgi:hypothetical protein